MLRELFQKISDKIKIWIQGSEDKGFVENIEELLRDFSGENAQSQNSQKQEGNLVLPEAELNGEEKTLAGIDPSKPAEQASSEELVMVGGDWEQADWEQADWEVASWEEADDGKFRYRADGYFPANDYIIPKEEANYFANEDANIADPQRQALMRALGMDISMGLGTGLAEEDERESGELYKGGLAKIEEFASEVGLESVSKDLAEKDYSEVENQHLQEDKIMFEEGEKAELQGLREFLVDKPSGFAVAGGEGDIAGVVINQQPRELGFQEESFAEESFAEESFAEENLKISERERYAPSGIELADQGILNFAQVKDFKEEGGEVSNEDSDDYLTYLIDQRFAFLIEEFERELINKVTIAGDF